MEDVDAGQADGGYVSGGNCVYLGLYCSNSILWSALDHCYLSIQFCLHVVRTVPATHHSPLSRKWIITSRSLVGFTSIDVSLDGHSLYE